MKTTKLRAFALPIAFFSLMLFSCKKDATNSKVTATNNSNSTEPIRANLVAWYKFTNGNTGDYSGNNNHLRAHNVTPDVDYFGRPNNAYYFNGHSYMQAANSTSLNPTSAISLAVLFKPTGFYTGIGEQSRILMKGVDDQSNGDYFLGYYNNGQAYATYGDNQFQSNGVITPDNTIQLNTWYKLVYTYNNGVGRIYINDVLVNEANNVASFNPNTSPLRIGKTGRSDYPYWFTGVIDEIRIYNKALNTNQIAIVDSQLGQH